LDGVINKDTGKVILKVTDNNLQKEFVADLSNSIQIHGKVLHSLAARQIIRELVEGFSQYHTREGILKDEYKSDAKFTQKKVEDLGVRYQLASKYTSFIAIDERNNEIVSEAQTIPQKRNVPQFLNMPGTRSFIGGYSSKIYHQLAASGSLSIKSGQAPAPAPAPPPPQINHKEPQIENLFEFLGLQSFDGKFLPKKSFYEFFYKNDLNDLIDLKQKIENDIGNTKESEIEEVLSTCISIAYLEIIMFEKFKDECEMCHEKAEKALKKIIGNDEKEKIIIEKSKEWINNWINNQQ